MKNKQKLHRILKRTILKRVSQSLWTDNGFLKKDMFMVSAQCLSLSSAFCGFVYKLSLLEVVTSLPASLLFGLWFWFEFLVTLATSLLTVGWGWGISTLRHSCLFWTVFLLLQLFDPISKTKRCQLHLWQTCYGRIPQNKNTVHMNVSQFLCG